MTGERPNTILEVAYKQLEWARIRDEALRRLEERIRAAFLFFEDLLSERIDADGWPTRDAAASEEDG